MAGSPSTVKYSAGRSGVALANMIWCASVVLPQPGAPAMMLKENSGRPPPRISSRPGIPVGNFLIVTFSCGTMITFSPGLCRRKRQIRPCGDYQTQHKIFSDQGDKQSE